MPDVIDESDSGVPVVAGASYRRLLMLEGQALSELYVVRERYTGKLYDWSAASSVVLEVVNTWTNRVVVRDVRTVPLAGESWSTGRLLLVLDNRVTEQAASSVFSVSALIGGKNVLLLSGSLEVERGTGRAGRVVWGSVVATAGLLGGLVRATPLAGLVQGSSYLEGNMPLGPYEYVDGSAVAVSSVFGQAPAGMRVTGVARATAVLSGGLVC